MSKINIKLVSSIAEKQYILKEQTNVAKKYVVNLTKVGVFVCQLFQVVGGALALTVQGPYLNPQTVGRPTIADNQLPAFTGVPSF